MKLSSSQDGYITALRFYKQPATRARTSVTSGRAPASSSPRRRSRTRPPPGGRSRRLRSRSRSRRTRRTSRPTTRPRATSRSAPATSRTRSASGALTAPRRRQRGLQVRRGPIVPDRLVELDELLGRRRVQRERAPGHERAERQLRHAGRRSVGAGGLHTPDRHVQRGDDRLDRQRDDDHAQERPERLGDLDRRRTTRRRGRRRSRRRRRWRSDAHTR